MPFVGQNRPFVACPFANDPRWSENSAMRRKVNGLTLVELMMGLAIMGIALALVAPGLAEWAKQDRLTTQTNDLVAALNHARSEAITRGVRVTICRSANPTAGTPSCGGSGGWGTGWISFVDNVQISGNASGVIDGPDTVLRVHASLPNTVLTPASNYSAWIAYLPNGLSRGNGGLANGTVRLCQGSLGRRITINSVGRLQTDRVSC